MKIVAPLAPKIPKELDAWDRYGADTIEVDRELVHDADFVGVTRISADMSRITGSILTGLTLDKLDLSDVSATKLEAAALHAYKAMFLRVELFDSRLTDADFAEGSFVDCIFRSIRFDRSGFRFAKFRRVRFENCIMRQSDFSHAQFEQVTFTECDLDEANFVSAGCKHLDVTTEDLTRAKGLLGLKGATISTEQLMQLAPLLAQELGFRVEDAF